MEQALAGALRAGDPATSTRAMDLAAAHRAHLERWFYDVPLAMHRGLGDMYLADPRFAAHYDAVEPGLAAYLRDAIHANAARVDALGERGRADPDAGSAGRKSPPEPDLRSG